MIRAKAESTQPGKRYVVERCRDNGEYAIYEVLDLERIAHRRVVCCALWKDACMIAELLNWGNFRHQVYGTDTQWAEAIAKTERQFLRKR